MPRTLKRRADLIAANDASEPSDTSPAPTGRRRRRPSPSSDDEDDESPAPTHSQNSTNTATLIKKLVRLALATSYTRDPLRRKAVRDLVLTDQHARQFNAIFAGAQTVLRTTFGMELVELPTREKTSLKERRAQATQTKTNAGNSNKSWVLVSCLPKAYKTNAAIVGPGKAGAGGEGSESEYTGLYTFIVTLIYLNNGSLSEAKLERYLKRVNADVATPAGTLDKLLARMAKDGYVEKKRDTSSGEEVVEWVVGGRGKIEVGVRGVAGLVREVYTNKDGTVKEDMEVLDEKLERSLGIKLDKASQVDSDDDELMVEADGDESAAEPEPEAPRPQPKKRGRPRKGPARDEDDG